MEADIKNSAAGISPGSDIDSILYGCTSASAAIGDERVRSLLVQGKPCAAASAHTPVSGVLAAFQALGVRKLSLIAPYPVDVYQMLARYLLELGLKIVSLTCLGLKHDIDNGCVPVDTLCDIATRADHKDADALFLSCTAMRGAEAAERIEGIVGMPVVASNQALLWHGLRQAGCDLKIPGFGQLMQI